YRQYTTSHLERIRFLKQCQAFGFTLAEAATLADSLESGAPTCEKTCNLAERKLTELKKKIEEYQKLATRIESLLDSPCRRTANADCSVVAALKTGSC
ncbi:MAG: MerR family DNA-binding protein, partial [Acidobacteria bacterium]|nr:MerR family DNA-binding protein [Acidobacteriota bacterium]